MNLRTAATAIAAPSSTRHSHPSAPLSRSDRIRAGCEHKRNLGPRQLWIRERIIRPYPSTLTLTAMSVLFPHPPDISIDRVLDFKMHNCLSVDEIVRLLACTLVASGAKGTAVALACCSKGLEAPVLDALWETQDQLTPLLKCLPQEVWEEDEDFVSRVMESDISRRS